MTHSTFHTEKDKSFPMEKGSQADQSVLEWRAVDSLQKQVDLCNSDRGTNRDSKSCNGDDGTITTEQQSQPPPSEGPTCGNGNACGKDVIALELTEEMQNEQLVTNIFSSFRSMSLIVMLNHKYENKPVNLPILEDWISTHNGFYDILVDNGVAEEDSSRIQRFCTSQHETIIDHFAQQALAHMSAGQKAKKERIEKAKNGPPIDVTIAQALTMHEGNVRVKGMISTGSDKMEKMITRVYFRCGECDHYNTLVDYTDNERYLRPVFIYELPQFNLKDKECIHGCKSSTHELREEVINAYRIELQETETFNDLNRLPIILFEDCINKVDLGEQVIVTGSVQRIRVKGRLLTYVFAGLAPKSTIERERRKESDELTDVEINEFQELGKSTKIVKDIITGKDIVVNAVLDELVPKFVPSVIGMEHVKKGILFCAANSGKDTYQRKLRINALMIGPPGLDKSALLRGATRLVSNSRFLSSLNSSTTSQIGIVDKEDERFMLRLGPIPRAAGRICAIDEMGRMRPEDQGKLLHALQEGMMPFVKYGFDMMLDGRATFIMASNTKNPSGDFNDANKVSSDEIPIISQVMDRTGLVFVLRANRTLGYSIDFGFKKLNIYNNINAVDHEEEKYLEFLRKYILYVKRFNPIPSKEAGVMIVQYYANVITKPNSRASPRLFDTLTALCFAVARLRQKNIIDVEDVKEVTEFHNVQLQHLTAAAAEIPRNPLEDVREKVVKTLEGSLHPRELTELVSVVQKTDAFVREYLGKDLHTDNNKILRKVRENFIEFPDERIQIYRYKPLTLIWKDSYEGIEPLGSFPIHDDGRVGDGEEEPGSKYENASNDPNDPNVRGIEHSDDGPKVADGTRVEVYPTSITCQHHQNIMSKLMGHLGHLGQLGHLALIESDDDSESESANKNIQVQHLDEQIECYEDYIVRQKKLFDTTEEDSTISTTTCTPDTTTANPSLPTLKLDSNGDPILPPYIHRLSAHSVWFKCEYCRYQDDKCGMAKHSHPNGSTAKKRGNR